MLLSLRRMLMTLRMVILAVMFGSGPMRFGGGFVMFGRFGVCLLHNDFFLLAGESREDRSGVNSGCTKCHSCLL
jgi:hypothetical protein